MPLTAPGSCHHSQVMFLTLQKTACVDCRVMNCPARLLNGQQIRPTREAGWPLIKQLGRVTPESDIEDIIVPNTPPLAGESQGGITIALATSVGMLLSKIIGMEVALIEL